MHEAARVEHYQVYDTIGGGHVTVWWGAGQWWPQARLVEREEAERMTLAFARAHGMLEVSDDQP